MTKEDYIHTTFIVEQPYTKITKEVRISIPVKSISSYYEYPYELDEVLEQDGTKIYCNEDEFVIKMNYDEFEKVYYKKLEAINKREGVIKLN